MTKKDCGKEARWGDDVAKANKDGRKQQAGTSAIVLQDVSETADRGRNRRKDANGSAQTEEEGADAGRTGARAEQSEAVQGGTG